MRVSALELGRLSVYPPVVQAPMAGVADSSFRVLNRRAGCPLVSAEMISDKALTYGSRATKQMIRILDEERPVSIQIFGCEPETMALAARIVIESSHPEVLDINMGCPVLKVVRNREGCALMRNIPAAAAVIRAVVCVAREYETPVTVKMRLGWSRNELTAVQLARAAESEGVAAVAVHGRTKDEYYSGKADWQGIGEVKANVKIPVIGNGDVRDGADAAKMLAQTGCDAVMIGRGALGNPWIFTQVSMFLLTGEEMLKPTVIDRLQMALTHARMLVSEKGERTAVREMRKHLAWYFKGMHHAARFRDEVNAVKDMAGIESMVIRLGELSADIDSDEM